MQHTVNSSGQYSTDHNAAAHRGFEAQLSVTPAMLQAALIR
jgi:hypothetical protein